jgi:hypothetical protein
LLLVEVLCIGIVQKRAHALAVECQKRDHIGAIQLQERFVKESRIRLFFDQIDDIRQSGAHVETLEDEKLSESDFMDPDIVDVIVEGVHPVVSLLLPLLDDGYQSLIGILPVEVQKVERINLQKTELVNRVRH